MQTIFHLFRLGLLLLSGSLLLTGLSDRLQRKLNARGLVPDQYRFGDLYNISNLPDFKELQWKETDDLGVTDQPAHRAGNVDLYTIGDSFTTMDTSFYAGHRNHHIWLGTEVETVAPDPRVHSILVIEVIERTIQERLREHYADLYIHRGFQVAGKMPVGQSDAATAYDGSFWSNPINGEINQRLEFLLFNSELALKCKEMKAGLMLNWFDRTHPGALISRDHRFLFYEVEASPKSVLSPFQPLTDADIDSVVVNMNRIRSHYRNAGFAEVYFCFIPNKVTVCEPGRHPHNNQIPRIEQNARLEAPLLKLDHELLRHPEWYHKSDGHWNVNGKRLWLRTVNALVMKWAGGHS
ncbi:hypothetical protein GCM10010967_18920 [Dyadobacter beijingensis]|uniref:AlgX/AlgJ SGNH hydrolase-like domain-containing protein n=1 Tax=Dyadobacter beijingensis TaxID=365489 RepID=A0ABQ2HNF8_9BACT|nr:hypothetical protein [Dyadobacter beijingensis]GGM86771.1 hypothetical protein GCM10010967_18920 [Dyadobacter beijingensis]